MSVHVVAGGSSFLSGSGQQLDVATIMYRESCCDNLGGAIAVVTRGASEAETGGRLRDCMCVMWRIVYKAWEGKKNG